MNPLWVGAAALLLAFALLWALSLLLRDASIVDPAWGMGFVLLAWIAWGSAADPDPARLLVPTLTTLWGVRLSLYLLWRGWGAPEDPRYAALRRRHPPFWLKSAYLVFGLQAALLWLVALPLMLVQQGSPAVSWALLPGLISWAVGLTLEALADAQLARFKADPANAGRVLTSGVWSISRHPNYLGELLVWWGLWGVALAQGAPAWTAISPLVMSGLLLRVSGVPLLEAHLRRTRSGYAEYARRTPALFPAWPGSRAGPRQPQASADGQAPAEAEQAEEEAP